MTSQQRDFYKLINSFKEAYIYSHIYDVKVETLLNNTYYICIIDKRDGSSFFSFDYLPSIYEFNKLLETLLGLSDDYKMLRNDLNKIIRENKINNILNYK